MTFPSDSNQSIGPATPAAPGWYPVDCANQQYWDGNKWVGDRHPVQPGPNQGQGYNRGPQALVNGTTSEERTMAMVTHLMWFIAPGLGPLVIYILKKDESRFVRHHAAEALNFAITSLVGVVGLFILAGAMTALGTSNEALFAVGFILLFVAYLLIFAFAFSGFIFAIIGAVKANGGEHYRIPLTFHVVK